MLPAGSQRGFRSNRFLKNNKSSAHGSLVFVNEQGSQHTDEKGSKVPLNQFLLGDF